MVISFLATMIAATVTLVPNAAVIQKSQASIPQETELDIPMEAKVIQKKDEKKEGTIVLRKARKTKTVRYIRNKKGKKIAVKEGPKTEFDNENLDDIYKKEREYFKSGRGSTTKKPKPDTVSGPLASIPLAVANSIASNIAIAKAERMPASLPPKPKPQTAEEILYVETTIQDSKGEPKITVKDESKKIPLKLPKKVEIKQPKKIEFKEQVEVKDEVAQEVQIVEADQRRNPASTKADARDLLSRVEKKYVTHYIKININSEVTQTLLERTKTYSGQLYLAPESRFKMDIKEPNKHMLLMNGKNIWVVDYPLDETQDKVQILHSTSAKSLKNQAFLDIFTGVGNLQKRFKIESSDKKNDEITYKLIPKKKDEQVERVELELDTEAELISTITFWDSLGNKTHLKFSKQEFEDKTPKDIFEFKPPKDASITNL